MLLRNRKKCRARDEAEEVSHRKRVRVELDDSYIDSKRIMSYCNPKRITALITRYTKTQEEIRKVLNWFLVDVLSEEIVLYMNEHNEDYSRLNVLLNLPEKLGYQKEFKKKFMFSGRPATCRTGCSPQKYYFLNLLAWTEWWFALTQVSLFDMCQVMEQVFLPFINIKIQSGTRYEIRFPDIPDGIWQRIEFLVLQEEKVIISLDFILAGHRCPVNYIINLVFTDGNASERFLLRKQHHSIEIAIIDDQEDQDHQEEFWNTKRNIFKASRDSKSILSDMISALRLKIRE